MEYTQLDKATRLNMVRARIRELEQQHIAVELRVKAPDLNQPPGNNMDQQNLQRLEGSLDALHQMEKDLSV